jgi:microsomal epoxide hydrolase
MADCVAALMHDVLGYGQFGAQGGDWGASVATRLAYAYPERMIGIHLNLMMVVARDPTAFRDSTEEERRFLDEFAYWLREETGYQWIQGTRPQTLAFGLTDSPAGLAAWMVEKFRARSDWGNDIQQTIRDRMLANVALYWFTGAIGSSFWPYYAHLHETPFVPAGERISVPIGYAEFPREIAKPPRSAVSRVFADLRRWTVMPRGGHFAALEQPELLANDVRAFFRELR